MVVPNGTLFGDGVCARIKEELLKEFNLHTIVRLPNGVFAPYTSIPTNLLFFDRSGPTKKSGITSCTSQKDAKPIRKLSLYALKNSKPASLGGTSVKRTTVLGKFGSKTCLFTTVRQR